MMNKMNKMNKRNLLTKGTVAVALAATVMTMAPVSMERVSANDGMGIESMKGYSIKDTDSYATVTSNSALNVRMAPSTKSAIINTAASGKQLHIVGIVKHNGKDSGWREIICKNKKYGGECAGYVSAQYLKSSGGGEEKSSYGTYKVSGVKNYLAIRSARSYNDANEIGKLYNGDKVKVLDQKGTYWKVSANGIKGYVNHNKLVKVK